MVEWIQNEILLKLLDEKSKKMQTSTKTADEFEAVSQLPSVKNMPQVIPHENEFESKIVIKTEAGVQADEISVPNSTKDEIVQTADIIESFPQEMTQNILSFARGISECILDEVISKESRKIGKYVHSELFEEGLWNKLNQESLGRNQFLEVIEAQRKEDQLERQKMLMEFNLERQKLIEEIREAQKNSNDKSVFISNQQEEALVILQQKLESTSPITSSPIKVLVKDQAIQSVIPNLSFEGTSSIQKESVSDVTHEALSSDKNSLSLDENIKSKDNTIEPESNLKKQEIVVERKTIVSIVEEKTFEAPTKLSFIHIGQEPLLVEKSLEKV